MTAYVLGATGHVGREVVRQLCVRGEKAIAHVRPDSSKLAEWTKTFADQGAEVDSTAWDAGELAKRWRNLAPAQIYILIGTTRHKAKSEALEGDIYEKVDLGLTLITVEAARASEAKPRLVYLSGLGADANARGAYMRARGKAEHAVRDSGLPWIIARPAIITGERDEGRFGESAAAVIGDGILAAVGLFGGKNLRDKWRSTTPDILAAALIRFGEAPEHDKIIDGADLR